jgi:hypothetical protein
MWTERLKKEWLRINARHIQVMCRVIGIHNVLDSDRPLFWVLIASHKSHFREQPNQSEMFSVIPSVKFTKLVPTPKGKTMAKTYTIDCVD